TGLQGRLSWSADGSMTFDPAGAYDDVASGDPRQVTFNYTARDNLGGKKTAQVTLVVSKLGTFHVDAAAADASGVAVTLSEDVDLASLNVYDGQDASADASDITLSGPGGVNIRGSAVWEAATRTLRFIP